MKKFFILVAIMLATTSAFSQGIISLMNRSDDFFKTMSEEKFKEAIDFFDPAVQTKITPDALYELWSKLHLTMGKFEGADVVQSKTEGEFVVVILDGKFEKDTQRFMIAYNKAEKIVGFYLQPKTNVPTYVKPAYADTLLYREKELAIKGAKSSLVAILTTPKKVKIFPIVVLVHGSGPADMDETVGANKPFKDLAAGLAAQGIATIRYVKRTLVYPGEFVGPFTVKEEVINDALAAVELAKTVPGVNKAQIYLLGHSLGGMLAPRMAASSPALKGIILVAAPAKKLADIMVEQNNYMYQQMKDTTQALKKVLADNVKELDQARITTLGAMKADSVILGLPASYWVDLNTNDQVAIAKKLTKRIMVVQGGNDFQVSAADYAIWNAAIGKKPNVTMKFYPELNHLLSVQKEKGTTAQYQVPSNVSPQLITDIANWIKAK
ncbi:MAG: alpha/beta fold hydrolase [Pedobacter sp.]|nr:MAG: alpha/beta fold hydrolase [Pedobacter sp.]